MSANEFGRETHWQIVRTDAAQPWHARLVSNYRTIMVSENYTRRRGALRAIELAAPQWLRDKTPLEVDERASREYRAPSGWRHEFDPKMCLLAGCVPAAEWVNQSDVEPE